MKFQKIKDTKTNIEYDWMLVIETKEELMTYSEVSLPSKVRLVWDNLIDVQKGRAHINTPLAQYISISADGSKSLFENTVMLLDKVLNGKLEMIEKYGKIFQNKNGGYMSSHKDLEVIDEFERKDNGLIFPQYTEKDIKVKQWEGGTHWYAYVGDIWCKDYEGIKKFDTKERALEVAESNLYHLNRKEFIIKN